MRLTRLFTLPALLAFASSGAVHPPASAAPSAAAARVADRTITYEEVDRRALVQDAARFRGLRLLDAIYEARLAALDAIIADHLVAREAAREGLAPSALLDREIAAASAPVTDGDVEAWFAANRERLDGAALEAVSGRIRAGLEDQRRAEARSQYIARLRQKANPRILLERPRDRITVAPDEPADGPAGAPVQIVMYSDYQCPFCARVEPTLERLKQMYGEQVRIVVRDYPITSIHPQAIDAAKAAHCAREQGRFWEYRDRLFANQSRMSAPDLLRHAADLGLDTDRFASCTTGERAASIVREQTASAHALGVSATPAFFVNGRFLAGAQPLEQFQRVIDEELAGASRPE